MAAASKHVPVMLDEALEMLGCRSGGRYVDGTLGGGGYAEAILRASAPDGLLIGVDWDADAIERAGERLSAFKDRLILKRASFAELPQVLGELEMIPVDGVVADLGVSSFHLDQPERGFSFARQGPLDMRMDRGLDLTAADLVNSLAEKDLADIIFKLGEERWSRRIARAIVTRRKEKAFSETVELAELIRGVVPKTKDSARIHPATRTFQALRLAVNGELEALEAFLSRALDVLRPGGRLCVVSFHSLEDRLVKVKFRDWARSCRCPKDVLVCRCEGQPLVRLLTKKAMQPGEQELEANPRARSARLRAVEKL